MNTNLSLWHKIINFIQLTVPIIITQFALTGGSFFSVVMTGQYSTTDVAGISVGFNIWIACYYGVLGILLGIAPIMAQLLGANKQENIPTVIIHGLWLAIIFSALLIISGLLFLKPLLQYLALEPAAYEVCMQYMKAMAFALPPLILTCTLRNTVDCHGHTRYSMIIMSLGLLIHITLNYTLILGNFGFPALGGLGAGIATAIAYWFNCLTYLGVLLYKQPFAKYRLTKQNWALQWTPLREQLRIGLPIGVAVFCESSIFSLAGLAITYYGTQVIAAHQAAISFVNLFYGIPLSISMASTIVVGYQVGAKQYKEATTMSYIARGSALAIATFMSIIIFTNLRLFASFYTNEPAMVDIIASFMSYAAFFIIIDAFGTPVQGILRAYKDVAIISKIAIATYWGACIPIALGFIYFTNLGPYSVWLGLLGGVGLAGILYIWRVMYLQTKRFI